MGARVKKFAAAAAGVILAGSVGLATPAAAGGYGWGGHGWGGHGWGGHGWGGHGWGYRGGWGPGWGYRHSGWGGGWGYRRGWGYGGYGWGAPVAAGLIGGLALGAAAASQPYYYAPACYLASQPVYDDWGDLVAYRRVRVCN